MPESTKQAGQEFEGVLEQSATDVASFDHGNRSVLERIQHMLMTNKPLRN